MNIGFEILRQEAAERAMRRYRSQQSVREQRRTGLGHGTRRITREEAVARIAKKSPRAAVKLLNGYLAHGREGRVIR